MGAPEADERWYISVPRHSMTYRDRPMIIQILPNAKFPRLIVKGPAKSKMTPIKISVEFVGFCHGE